MFKTYIIVIRNNEVSENYAKVSEMALAFNNIEYERFDAITPETLHLSDLKVSSKRSSTEHACFASHYELWKKCVELNKPIAIIEHDSIMVKPYPKYPQATSFLGYTAYDNKYKIMFGAAYIIRPEVAKNLIKVVTASPMSRQLDNMLFRYFHDQQVEPYEKHKCFIVNNIGPVTIEHNK